MNIPMARADEPKWKVRQVLEKSKPPKPNLSKEERLAIKSLQRDRNKKVNVTVVMDKSEYPDK